MGKIYYKVLGADCVSPTTRFDYSKYLPTGKEASKWLPEIPAAKISEDGYYVSPYWNMWYKEGDRIFEAECEGIVDDGVLCGVKKQVCCAKIRLVREITATVARSLCAEANLSDELSTRLCNTGVFNTGSRNTGGFNTGNFNTGNRNTGNLNSGDFNTGDSNEGIDNVGDLNRGSGNVGSRNVGHSNTGDSNIGSFNSGSGNRGNGNAGSFNTGSFNVGKWNVGNFQTGFFNTQEPTVRMFNKPTSLRQSEIALPKWLNRADCSQAFWKAKPEEIQAALDLPNFDFEIFETITGISKSDFEKRLGRAL